MNRGEKVTRQMPSERKPTGKRRKERAHTRVYSWRKIGAACVLLILVVFLGLKGWQWYQLETELANMQREEQRLREERRALEAEKKKYTDPAEVEKEARRQLGLVKEKEVPYIR